MRGPYGIVDWLRYAQSPHCSEGSPYFSMTTENESSEQSSSCISLAIPGPCFALSSTGSTGQPAEGRPFQCFGSCDDPAASRALEKVSFIIICSKLQLPEAPAGSAVEHGEKSWTTWRGAEAERGITCTVDAH